MKAHQWRSLVGAWLAVSALLAGCSARNGPPARPTEAVVPPPPANVGAVVWRTEKPPTAPSAGDVWVCPATGIELVYVPAGEFVLGSSSADITAWLKNHPYNRAEQFADQQPQCRPFLEAYWIGRTEVTNGQYLEFVRATGHPAPAYWDDDLPPGGLEQFPVERVSNYDAREFCRWAGFRLPTEMEWEKAARGADGRTFPWGDEWHADLCRDIGSVTGRSIAGPREWEEAYIEWSRRHDATEGPTRVGSYPQGMSPYGCLDMAGNVLEWCQDAHDKRAYQNYAAGDMAVPRSGPYCVYRGGSWLYGDPYFFRCSTRTPHRFFGDYGGHGFRVALDAR